MPVLSEMVGFLNRELRVDAIRDYPGAWNGLQVENDGMVRSVAAAVDATRPVIELAALHPDTLLLVHHGLFWQGVQPITGAFREKLGLAFQSNLAIYSAHLPLDLHPEWGNNILLARAVGLVDPQPFLEESGTPAGLVGGWEGKVAELEEALQRVLGGPVHVCAAGPNQIRRVGLVTGGAGSMVGKAALEGVDAFITGEGPHWSYGAAEEHRVHLLYGGHYATETFGVRALADAVARQFGLKSRFLHHPSGL